MQHFHCPQQLYFKEEEVHAIAYSLRIRAKSRPGTTLKRILRCVDKKYVWYLERLRSNNLGRERAGTLVEQLTRKNVHGYLSTVTRVKVFGSGLVADLIRLINHNTEELDDVRLTFYQNALVALKGYASTYNDYQKNARLPSYSSSVPLNDFLFQLNDFLKTELCKFDAKATYPDAVMCLCLLQYLNYKALLDSNFKLLIISMSVFRNTVLNLQNMSFVTTPVVIPSTRE